jgi:hypothetical protein
VALRYSSRRASPRWSTTAPAELGARHA